MLPLALFFCPIETLSKCFFSFFLAWPFGKKDETFARVYPKNISRYRNL